jgi:hypothetical protein
MQIFADFAVCSLRFLRIYAAFCAGFCAFLCLIAKFPCRTSAAGAGKARRPGQLFFELEDCQNGAEPVKL